MLKRFYLPVLLYKVFFFFLISRFGLISNLVLCGGVTEVGSLNGCSPFLASDEDSWSDGEQEPITVDQTWRGDPDSEADSIDSDQEDPLK